MLDTIDATLYGTTPDSVGYLQPVAVDDVFYGLVQGWDLSEERLQLRLVSELALWRKRALRPATASCPWEFKGSECGYSGDAEWCNQSYLRCQALNNTNNFGGFRFLPAIMEANIWWGGGRR